jgi:hypothetical protein
LATPRAGGTWFNSRAILLVMIVAVVANSRVTQAAAREDCTRSRKAEQGRAKDRQSKDSHIGVG